MSRNHDFLLSPQNVTNQKISRTWEAQVAILDSETWLSRSLLVSLFHYFCEWPKINKSVCFSILFNAFRPSNTIDFPIVFILFFIFVQNRSRSKCLEGSSAELLWKVGFGCQFRFLWFSKRHPLDDLFASKDEKKRSPPNGPGCPSSDPAFHDTRLITVPLGPTVFLKVMFVDGDWLVFVSFHCAMFYIIVL